MSARTDLADALRTALPAGWRVIASDVAGTVGKPTVLVYRAEVTHRGEGGLRDNTLTVVVVGPKQIDPDDDLDGYLDDVLDVLDATPLPVAWTTAERSVYDDTFPAYKITTTMTTRDEA